MKETVEGKSKLLELLRTFKRERRIVSIFSDSENTNKFSSGYVVAVSDTYVLVALLDPNGRYFGFGTFVLDDIYALECEGKYEKKLAILHSLSDRIHADIELLTGDIMLDLLTFAYYKALIVTVEVFTSGLDNSQGFVTDISDGVLVLSALLVNKIVGEKEYNRILEVIKMALTSYEALDMLVSKLDEARASEIAKSAKIELIKKFLLRGYPLEEIVEDSGLSYDEVLALKDSL